MNNRIMFVILIISFFVVSGCINGEQYYQRKAGQKLVDTLDKYNTRMDILKKYDADCLKNSCVNECINEKSSISDVQARSFNCNMECGKVEMIEVNANNFPQCSKSNTNEEQECPAIYKCKNPIQKGMIVECPESELKEYMERCMKNES